MLNPCACSKALWVKFQLTDFLGRDSSSAPAIVYTAPDGTRQFWQGDDPDPDNVGFPVLNQEDCPTSSFLFQFVGCAGDIGLACLDDSDPADPRYRIVQVGNSCCG
jgi:hypothetical protein